MRSPSIRCDCQGINPVGARSQNSKACPVLRVNVRFGVVNGCGCMDRRAGAWVGEFVERCGEVNLLRANAELLHACVLMHVCVCSVQALRVSVPSRHQFARCGLMHHCCPRPSKNLALCVCIYVRSGFYACTHVCGFTCLRISC